MERYLRKCAVIAILGLLLSQCRKPNSAEAPAYSPQSQNNTDTPAKDSAPPPSTPEQTVASNDGSSNPESKKRGVVIEGNGGEHITNEQNPWFLGSDPVHYCLKHDPTAFSVDPDQVRKVIHEALQTWLGFIKTSYPYKLEAPLLLAQKGITSLALDFSEVSCAEPHELVFLLGVTDSDISDALEYRAKEIIALSFRDEYSDDVGRAKGRIWLTPDLGDRRYQGPNPGPGFWGKQHHLQNVMTHELGHVFGVKHSEVGLMAADFPAKMLEFGLNTTVGQDSLQNNFKMCGKIFRKEDSYRDPKAALAKLFDLDIKTIDQVCIDTSYFTPSHDFGKAEGDRYLLSFYLKDGTKKDFEGLLSSLKGPYQSIGGNFLAQANGEDVHYSPFTIIYFDGPFNGQGIQSTSVGDSFITFDSFLPSTLTLSIGYEGDWQNIFLVKDNPEARGMMKLAAAEQKDYSILSLSFKKLTGGKAPNPANPSGSKAGKVSFTPESLLVPISSISLRTWGGPDRRIKLYQCKVTKEKDCLIDVSDQTSLDKLSASIRIEDSHYQGLVVKPVCKNGEYTTKVKGQFTLGGTTYYTQSRNEVLGTDAAKYDYADVKRKCEGQYIVPFPILSTVTKIAGGTFPFTISFDSNYVAVGDPGLPTGDATPRSPSINLGLRIFPNFGASEVTLDSYKLVDTDTGAQGLLKLLKDGEGKFLEIASEEFWGGDSASLSFPHFMSRNNLFARKEAYTEDDDKGRGGPVIEVPDGLQLRLEGLDKEMAWFEAFRTESHSSRFAADQKWFYYTATKF